MTNNLTDEVSYISSFLRKSKSIGRIFVFLFFEKKGTKSKNGEIKTKQTDDLVALFLTWIHTRTQDE